MSATQSSGPPRVSVAIPVYNEEEVAPELINRVTAVLDELPGGPHELVLVDDGSRDRTVEIIEEHAKKDSRIVLVKLSRNFGHQAALSAGLDHVRGDVVVVMDGDLQDTPETIPAFLEKHAEGHEVVYAIRAKRKEHALLRFSYAAFYRLIRMLAHIDLPVGSGDFALLTRRVVDEMCRTRERNRYLRGLRTWVGFRQTGIVIERDARAGGEPKYSARQLFRLAFDGIFSFSIVPIRMTTTLGFISLSIALLWGLWTFAAWLFLDRSPLGYTSLIIVTLLMSGTQLLFLGVIGEYIGRIYEEVKQRPIYVVDRVTGDR